MAQNANGNTKHSRLRARHWCFTLNNYEEKDCINLCKLLAEGKYVFQKEVGESGTKHLQGFVSFKNPRTLKGIKGIDNRIHWEVARNINAAKDYCWKEATSTGEVFSNFEYKKKVAQGTGTNKIELSETIKKSIFENYQEFIKSDEFKNWKFIEKLEFRLS